MWLLEGCEPWFAGDEANGMGVEAAQAAQKAKAG
jgi:hypothetical protein